MDSMENTVAQIIRSVGSAPGSITEVPAGLLVTLSPDNTPVPPVAGALAASGYTVAPLQGRTLLVGGVDPVALLDAQIATLTAEREALVSATWRCRACATYVSNTLRVCDVCDYTREGRDTHKNAV
ncbi:MULTISPECIES: hypothetical protein [Nocardiopsis]|uniref:RanBP2-type domain-containing protein n=1 Tax=Nocardiopsis sinuspersici TaxID=501010 RepID=A0A1V3BV05_9ACTN|nr:MULTISPECIES: hypothetical protein [Nocardiopsis]OOC52474.1 hypothetical protein NOSIN_00340 [Nocardiopsis sinuspersici]